MEAIDLLRTRRSVKAADMAEPGPDERELRLIIEAGLRVPDHGKLGPWRVQLLRKAGQRALGEVFAEHYRRLFPNAAPSSIEFERMRPQRAPVLLVVTSKPVQPHKIPLMEQMLSAAAVCMNLLNAAHALGFAAQWLTEWPAYDAGVRAALGHGEGDQVVGFIYVGARREAPEERDRPAYDAVVSEWAGPARP